MADVKTLQTRIALKYDTYANWTDDSVAGKGANLVLLKGEIGICEIASASQGAQTAPTVLFKVGNGEKKFSELKWASALAADVYGWAKASDVILEGKSIKFVGAKNEDGSDKVVTIPYMTETEVKAITDPLASRISTLESKFDGDNSVQNQIDALDGRLDTAEGNITTLGNTKLDKSTYETYIDGKSMSDADLKKYAEDEADAAEAAAKKHADDELAKAVQTLNAKDAELVSADDAIKGRLDVIEGEGAGSIKKAAADAVATAAEDATSKANAAETAAKGHADSVAATAKSEAITAANGYTDTAVAGVDSKITAHTSATGNVHGLTLEDIGLENVENKSTATIKSEFTGTIADGNDGFVTGDAVYDAIEAAKTAAHNEVDALKNNEVAENTRLIGVNAQAIAALEAEFDEDGRVTTLETAVADHEDRLDTLEAFFDAADADGKDTEGGKTLYDALDTLKEIQDYIINDGQAAADMLDAIDANAKAIEELDGEFTEFATVADADITALEGRADALEAKTAGFDGTIKAAVDAAAALGQQGIDDAKAASDKVDTKAAELTTYIDGKASTAETNANAYTDGKVATLEAADSALTAEAERLAGLIATNIENITKAQNQADKGVEDAGKAQAAAEAADAKAQTAQDEVDALEIVVSGVSTVANDAQSRVAAVEPKVEQAEKDIDALEAIVKTGDDTNAKLRADITDLQGIVKTGADANATLRADLTTVSGNLTTLAGIVNNETAGLAATKVIADRADAKSIDNANRIKAIEDDYLKAADNYVFYCGSASVNTYED